MNPTLKQLNKIVLAFLNKNADTTNLVELWKDSVNQKHVKNILCRANRLPKDPNAPKRGKSSYLYFCADNRTRVKDSLGKDSKATDVTKKLGILWNELKRDKKKKKDLEKYELLARNDKERYLSEKNSYTPPAGFYSNVSKPGPKRAKSAYLYFCSANRAQVKKDLGEGSKATEVTSELGVRWNAFKASGKTKEFDEMALKDRTRYQNEKYLFNETLNNQREEEELVEKAPKKAAKKAAKKAPKKAPKKGKSSKKVKRSVKTSSKKKSSGYDRFCTEYRAQYKKDHPTAKVAEIMKKMSTTWKKMSKVDQESYK